MIINIYPGRIIVRDPYFGNFEWDGLHLSRLENAALFLQKDSDITGLLSKLDQLIPGAWPYIERLDDRRRNTLIRQLKADLYMFSRELIAGNVYRLFTLIELAHSVREWQELEKQEQQREQE